MGNYRALYLACIVWLSFVYSCFGSILSPQQECVLAQAERLVGLKETSHNSSPQIDRIILAAGGKLRESWCGHSQKFIFQICCKIKVLAGGMASSWFPRNRLISRNEAGPGDHAGISYSNKGVQHVTMVKMFGPGRKFVITLEGNYGNAFKIVTRPAGQIYAWARWWK